MPTWSIQVWEMRKGKDGGFFVSFSNEKEIKKHEALLSFKLLSISRFSFQKCPTPTPSPVPPSDPDSSLHLLKERKRLGLLRLLLRGKVDGGSHVALHPLVVLVLFSLFPLVLLLTILIPLLSALPARPPECVCCCVVVLTGWLLRLFTYILFDSPRAFRIVSVAQRSTVDDPHLPPPRGWLLNVVSWLFDSKGNVWFQTSL